MKACWIADFTIDEFALCRKMYYNNKYLIDIFVSHVQSTELQAEKTSTIIGIGFALFASMFHPK